MSLLLLFSRGVGDPTAPVLSVGYGVLCLETTIFADELDAAVLIGQLESAVSEEMSTTIHTTTVSSVYTC